ncbi:hypothetical protein, partial [Bartonella henselae]|uniref:hypothetical protein n=4 Tax=Bartonella henselae TaxID=38323 RepID=UPI001AEBE04C
HPLCPALQATVPLTLHDRENQQHRCKKETAVTLLSQATHLTGKLFRLVSTPFAPLSKPLPNLISPYPPTPSENRTISNQPQKTKRQPDVLIFVKSHVSSVFEKRENAI